MRARLDLCAPSAGTRWRDARRHRDRYVCSGPDAGGHCVRGHQRICRAKENVDPSALVGRSSVPSDHERAQRSQGGESGLWRAGRLHSRLRGIESADDARLLGRGAQCPRRVVGRAHAVADGHTRWRTIASVCGAYACGPGCVRVVMCGLCERRAGAPWPRVSSALSPTAPAQETRDQPRAAQESRQAEARSRVGEAAAAVVHVVKSDDLWGWTSLHLPWPYTCTQTNRRQS